MSTHGAVIMEGDFQSYQLSEVLEVAGLCRQLIQITLSHASASGGQIMMKAGQVLAASQPTLQRQGLHAFQGILSSEYESFQVLKLPKRELSEQPLGRLEALLKASPSPSPAADPASGSTEAPAPAAAPQAAGVVSEGAAELPEPQPTLKETLPPEVDQRAAEAEAAGLSQRSQGSGASPEETETRAMPTQRIAPQPGSVSPLPPPPKLSTLPQPPSLLQSPAASKPLPKRATPTQSDASMWGSRAKSAQVPKAQATSPAPSAVSQPTARAQEDPSETSAIALSAPADPLLFASVEAQRATLDQLREAHQQLERQLQEGHDALREELAALELPQLTTLSEQGESAAAQIQALSTELATQKQEQKEGLEGFSRQLEAIQETLNTLLEETQQRDEPPREAPEAESRDAEHRPVEEQRLLLELIRSEGERQRADRRWSLLNPMMIVNLLIQVPILILMSFIIAKLFLL